MHRLKECFRRRRGKKEPPTPTGTPSTKVQPPLTVPVNPTPEAPADAMPTESTEEKPAEEEQQGDPTDLWVAAFNSLPDKQQKLKEMGFDQSSFQSGSTKSRIDDLISEVKKKQEACEEKFWDVKIGTKEIVLRNYTTNIVDWLGKAGDIAVQFAPQAAAPWAVIKCAMQVAVIEGEQMAALLATTEKIVKVVSRGQVYEDVYLKSPDVPAKLSGNLRSALVDIYKTSLGILAESDNLFSKHTPSRVLQAILSAGKFPDELSSIDKQEDELMKTVAACRDISANISDAKMKAMLQALDAPMKRVDEGVQHLLRTMEQEERLKLLEWVSLVPFGDDHNRIKSSRTADTGGWLLKHDGFINWDQGESSIFWLQGNPGTGKTFLTSTVIDFVHDRLNENPRDEGFAFFYCKKDERQRSDPLSILQSIVRQLSTTMKNPKAVQKTLEKLYDQCREGGSTLTLGQCKKQILESISIYQQTTIIIDAMDECDFASRDQLIDSLKQFISVPPTKNVKIFISSRPESDIENLLDRTPNIGIDASDNKEDIRKYLKQQVSKHAVLRPFLKPLQEEVIQILLEGSQGMFQSAMLQAAEVRECKWEVDLRGKLGKLPKDLKEAYDRRWSQVEKSLDCNRMVVSRAMMWVMASKTPLLSSQLLCAVRINVTGEQPVLSDAIGEQGLLSLCKDLLTVDPQPESEVKVGPRQNVWRFTHLSVRGYLETRMNWHLPQVNLHVACACLSWFINTYDKEDEGINLIEWKEVPEPTDLYHPMHYLQLYMRHHWAKHVQAACDEEGKLSVLLKRFLGSPEKSSKEYQKWIWLIEQDAFDVFKITPRANPRGLGISNFSYVNASGFDTQSTIETNDLDQARFPLAPFDWDLFGRGPEFDSELFPADSAVFAMCHFSLGSILGDWWEKLADTSFVNERGHDLLTLAARVGCTEICKILLEKGADVKRQVGGPRENTYGSALIAAAHCGHTETVQFLVEQGADVNMEAQNGAFPRALIAAIATQRTDIVRYLVQATDVNVNVSVNVSKVFHREAPDWMKMDDFTILMTPVGMSAFHEDTEILKMLVDAEANLNLRTECENPLCVALAAENAEVVKYLVQEAKCDVNLPISDVLNLSFHTILEKAVVSQDLDVIKLLVEAGAHINPSECGTDGPPLCRAILAESSLQSKHDIIHYLVSNGADIDRGDGNKSPIMLALDSKDIQSLQLLVEAGAKFDAQELLEKAFKNNFGECVRYLTYEYPRREQLGFNGTDGGLLELVAANPHFDVPGTSRLSFLKFLVESGANLDFCSKFGDYGSPLIAACGRRGNVEIVEWMIGEGADVNITVQHGLYESPLTASILGSRKLKVVKALVRAGADVNQPLQGGEYPSPLAAAVHKNNIRILRFLLDSGATVTPSLEQGEYGDRLEAARQLEDLGNISDDASHHSCSDSSYYYYSSSGDISDGRPDDNSDDRMGDSEDES